MVHVCIPEQTNVEHCRALIRRGFGFTPQRYRSIRRLLAMIPQRKPLDARVTTRVAC